MENEAKYAWGDFPMGNPTLPTGRGQNQLLQFDSELRQSDREVGSDGSRPNVVASASIDVADQKLFAIKVIAGWDYLQMWAICMAIEHSALIPSKLMQT